MNIRTVAKTFGIATLFAISLSACSNATPAPAPQQGSNGGGNVSSQAGGSQASTPDNACSDQDLSAALRKSTGGKANAQVEITNNGKECTLSETHPLLQFNGREGTPLEGLRYQQGGAPVESVTLAPGEKATANLIWASEEETNECGMAWAASLSIDGMSQAKQVDLDEGTFPVCGDSVTVGPWEHA